MIEEIPTKTLNARTSSKRSRAAEVHNLSEKVCLLHYLFIYLLFFSFRLIILILAFLISHPFFVFFCFNVGISVVVEEEK